jgi:hypothetical protein
MFGSFFSFGTYFIHLRLLGHIWLFPKKVRYEKKKGTKCHKVAPSSTKCHKVVPSSTKYKKGNLTFADDLSEVDW